MARGAIVKRCPVCKRNNPSCKHKEAVYAIVYRVGKRQKWHTVGPNKKEAERLLAETVSQVNNGTYSKLTDVTFEEFAQNWLYKYATGAVKPSTLTSYGYTIKSRLIPVFGNQYLRHISSESIQGFIAESLKHSQPKTVNNSVILLKTMLKYARRWGYIRENPALDIDNVPLQHKEMDFLNPDEIKLLLKHSKEPYKTLFMTASMTGMRRGELLALQWGDIDWNSNTIFVRRSIYFPNKQEGSDKRWAFVEPKSRRSIRALVLSPILKETLEIHRITCPVNQYDLVFCNKDGGPLDPSNMIKREFHTALVAAGLRKIRFHDLRHTYTSLLISQNENIKFIQSQLGHASIQTTLDRYGHLMPNHQEGVGSRIDQQVFGSANTVLTEYPKTSQNVSKQELKEIAVTISNT